jgi:hypothetical protein
VRVHEQEPVRWEEHEVRFESRLFLPEDEHPSVTYLLLSLEDLIGTARRLRDQLTAHLDAADSDPSARTNAEWSAGLGGGH